jgi:predicted DNA-binding transcriptional regulator AlpA
VETQERGLNKKQLASSLGIGTTTLWRCLKYSSKKAKKFKLDKMPVHALYPGGRKYFYASEIKQWLEMVADYRE